MTVVMFEGDSAEQEWQQDIATYSGLRHPNILQIYGVASSGSIHAAVFHGDLVPLHQFLHLHKHSPVLKVYIRASTMEQFGRADDYLTSHGQRLMYGQYNVWIKPSTGTISLEFTTDYWEGRWGWPVDAMAIQNPAFLFNAPNREAMAIDCMSLHMYHQICHWILSYSVDSNYLPTFTSVTLGAVVSWPHSRQPMAEINSFTFEVQRCNFSDDCVELASVEHIKVDICGWFGSDEEGVVMANGWTRFSTRSVISSYPRAVHLTLRVGGSDIFGWLSQANHVLKRLEIASNFHNYVFLEAISIYMRIQPITENTPIGYLFLCPASHFRTGPASFTWPDCPAYWSLDFSGMERLSTEEARYFGFPSFESSSQVSGTFWEGSTYAGLRQFHAGKGFDPDSQELAHHLEYPLYQLSSEVPTHVDAEAEVAESAAMTQLSASDFSATSATSAHDSEGRIHDKMAPVSGIFKLLMNFQLGLILFIFVYQACEAIF
ncbi:hypothetical protein C8F04DRAFT_1127236 [Mycena alexandri]|uniref:Uncharacterized protein n=1 Tax=Mycena alexandri TaxID=1745969 RepID=A0AAD6SE39_9AGAR|nr:hypothetical protein C8F04DRAFT_1127236 [Mycena alexandri]